MKKRSFADVLQEAKNNGWPVTIWFVTGVDDFKQMEIDEIGVDFFSTTRGRYVPFTSIARLIFANK